MLAALAGVVHNRQRADGHKHNRDEDNKAAPLVLRQTRAAGSGGLKLELPLQTTTVLIAPTQRGRALQLAAADAVRAISSAILLSDIRHRRERPLQQTVE